MLQALLTLRDGLAARIVERLGFLDMLAGGRQTYRSRLHPATAVVPGRVRGGGEHVADHSKGPVC